jgi:rubrerythrin
MGLSIDFSMLDAQDVLDIAIQVEQEAQDNYEQISTWMKSDRNEDAADFFAKMAKREARHREQLEVQRNELFGDAASRHTDSAVWQVEQPDYEAIGRAVTLDQAIDLAMDAERRAGEYYAGALEYVSDSKVAELFDGLRRSEEEHLRLLQEQRNRLVAGGS